MRKIILSLSAVAFLTACTGPNGQDQLFNKENLGTVLGGAAGAWAGSSIGKGRGNTIATAVGGVLGAAIGNQIGKGLDERDRMLVAQTTHNTLESAPSYEPATWRNPDSGRYGEVVAQPAYQHANSGQQCRNFTQTIFVEGQAETARGTACRQSDGTWDIVN